MLAFEVLVNGKRLCIAGTGTSKVISTTVSWARRSADTINFHVGGIVADESNEHFAWTTPPIGIGDEITIRLVDADSWDNPQHLGPPPTIPNE